MSDGPEWFAQKRFGYGAGLPIAWQGWAILIGYAAAIGATAYQFSDRPDVVFVIIIPLSLLLVLIAARTTRGGWRWRWGKEDRNG